MTKTLTINLWLSRNKNGMMVLQSRKPRDTGEGDFSYDDYIVVDAEDVLGGLTDMVKPGELRAMSMICEVEEPE